MDADTSQAPTFCAPDITDKLRTTFTPSGPESTQIVYLIGEMDRHLEEFDRALTEMLARRATLQRRRDEYAALLSPIRKLPAEILAEIFSWLVCGSGCYGLQASYKVFTTETLKLSQVCCVWREVANSTPSLWAHIFVNFQASYHKSLKEALQLYLTRSKDTPLTLEIVYTYEGPLSYKVETEDWSVFDILLSESWRWKDVSCILPWGTFIEIGNHPAWKSVQGFPQLEIISLKWSQELYPYAFFRPLQNTPNLHSLALPSPFIRKEVDLSHPFPLPLSQLSSFKLSGRNSNTVILALLHQASNLQHLTICHSVGWRSYDAERPSVDLPSPSFKLTSLSLCIESKSILKHQQLLDVLVLSSLKTLLIAISGLNETRTAWGQFIVGLLRRSSCPLENLTLRGTVGISMDNLIDIVSSTSNLTQLVIFDRQPHTLLLTDQFFQMLTIPSDELLSTPLLPRLTHLDFRFNRISSIPNKSVDRHSASAASIVSMAESRWYSPNTNIASLLSLTFFIHPCLHSSGSCAPHDSDVVGVDQAHASCLGSEFINSETELRMQNLTRGGMDIKVAATQDQTCFMTETGFE